MRKFGPRPKDANNNNCPACKKAFKEGDFTTLVALGPGDSEESQERAKAGRVYNAVAVEVHWDCSATKYEESERSEL